MNDRLVLTDDLLRRALERRMAHPASPLLLDRIVAGAGSAAQERAPRRWVGSGSRLRTWTRLPAFAGVAAILVVAVLVVVAIRPRIDVPGGSPSPAPSPTSSPTPSPAASPAFGSPEPIDLDGRSALRLPLGLGSDPIDTIVAFGSVWTANIHGNHVRRFDPTTLAEQARIPLPPETGPAWLIATGTEVWVSNQLDSGLTRIDPDTNTVIGRAGAGPTCGAPFQALDSVWQAACDAGTFLRLDPATGETQDSIPSDGHPFLVGVGDRLITTDADGLVELDPETGELTSLPGSIPGYRNPAEFGGGLFAADGEFVWTMTITGPARVDPSDGQVIATFPYPDAQFVSFAAGRAWLVVSLVGVVEIDLATNQVIQTIPVFQTPLVAREANGVLWVTDFDNSYLWRIEP
jgi:DNA-binding beta-propeller fold protein YncE